MSTSDSVAIRVWPIPWVPWNPARPYWPDTTAGIAQVLDQLQRVAERHDLGTFDVLDVAGQALDIAVER